MCRDLHQRKKDNLVTSTKNEVTVKQCCRHVLYYLYFANVLNYQYYNKFTCKRKINKVVCIYVVASCIHTVCNLSLCSSMVRASHWSSEGYRLYTLVCQW